jgi:hypothetical protein
MAEQERLDRMVQEVVDQMAGRPPSVEVIEALLKPPPPSKRPVFRAFHCSFCDRSRNDVRKLISGPMVFICDDCTGDAGGLLAASGWRSEVVSPAVAVISMNLAEQTRQVLATLTPREEQELRVRYGIG